MRIDDRRRSTNFEDRGTGRGGVGGGVPIQALTSIVRLLGVKGTVIVGALAAAVFFVLPAELKQELLVALTGDQGAPSAPGAGSVCQASDANGAACDFSRVVLAARQCPHRDSR